jgi:hypothetical protein
LGLKQLGADPWQNIARRYPANTRLFGKVTNIADYGCFVEIEEGVEGLVHVSEMDWTNKNVNPAKVVHVGQEVEVMVLDIDEERRRIARDPRSASRNCSGRALALFAFITRWNPPRKRAKGSSSTGWAAVLNSTGRSIQPGQLISNPFPNIRLAAG